MKTREKSWKMGSLVLLCAALTACAGGNGGNEGAQAASGDAPKTADGKTAVTMTVMTKDRFLTEAEQKFEAAHPDIDVQIEEIVPADTSSGDKIMVKTGPGGAAGGPKPEDVDKYVNSVNTAIMSGNASDIIAVENLPVDKYVDKGLLADWNELAAGDSGFNKSDYYENIFNGVSNGNGWYGIPTSVSLDAMLGDASLLQRNGMDDRTWTWDQFVGLLEKTKEDGKYGIANMEPAQLLQLLAESVYGELVTKDGSSASFDAAAFRTYMENVKKLYDEGIATSEQMGMDSSSFSRTNMANPLTAALKVGGESRDLLRPPGTGEDEGIPFKSNQVLALNAKSKAKDAAWAFVKYLLSDEMQSSLSLSNFPVHRAAVKNKLVETQQMLQNQGSGDSGGGKKMRIQLKGPDGQAITPELTDEDIQRVVDLMPSVGKYSNKDPKVMSMITEESAAYFSGSKSSDAVAKSLANRINTYLNE